MYTGPVTYFRPTTLGEALDLVERFGDEAKVLSGGLSLVPMMNLQLIRPQALVDLGSLRGLRYIRAEGGTLRIGALTAHAEIEHSELLREVCPLLPAAAELIGHVQIRNRGTVGGSLAHADPAAEWPTIMTCLDARVRVQSTGGGREMPVSGLFLTYLSTTLSPGELITEVVVPIPPAGHGWSVQEVARRQGDFALVSAATVMTCAGDGMVSTVRTALGSVGPVPADVTATVTAFLEGHIPTEALLREAANAVTDGLEPESDIHASAEYRRELAAELTYRSLREAWDRCCWRRGT